MIVGLSGYARAGKDTAALALIEERGFRRVGFADKLREFALAIDPIVSVENLGYGAVVKHRLSHRVNAEGWTEAKRVPEVRTLLQRLGTEAGRKILGDNVWIDAALRGIDANEDVVITDVRFPNEAQAIRDRCGEVWRIERPGLSAVNAHESETALDGFPFDATIYNGTTVEHLRENVIAALDVRLRQRANERIGF